MYSALRQPVIALLFAAIAGCGQMGPLYLPDEGPPANSTPVAEDSATATEDPVPAGDAARPDEDEG